MATAIQNGNPAASLFASFNSSKVAANDRVAETQDRFLKLLVTQMKNQDPLNPLDNAEVTTQMAQLSTVSGIDRMNSTLQALSASMISAQTLSATGMIGHGVLVPGSSISLVNGKALGGVELVQPADNLTVTIYGEAGNVVRTLQLGEQGAGVLPFAWDGLNDQGEPAGDGNYRFVATATLSGERSTPETLAFDFVQAVTPGAQGAMLDVGRLGSFALSAVRHIM